MVQRTLDVPSLGQILDDADFINVSLEFELIQRPFMSYGYGQINTGEYTYFDGFDLIGEGYGYFTDPFGLVEGELSYGYGYELTSTLREGILDADQLVEVNVAITPAATYTVNIGVVGPGQLFLYYDPVGGGYSSTFLDGTNFITYQAETDAGGLLSFKIGVPYSLEEVAWHRGWFSDSTEFQRIHKPRGPGIVDVFVSVPDKLLEPDVITAMGALDLTQNELIITSYGYIDNRLLI